MTIDISTFLNQPLNIGNKTIEKRLCLAPLTGLGHIAYREMLSSFGGYGLLFSEMCSAKKISKPHRDVSAVFRWRNSELSHLVCQIFGSDPATMTTAAKIIEDEGFFGVDINFGCSVASICKQNCGAALLKTPSVATRIVASVRKAVSIPLFVKYRTGWENSPRLAIELAKRFEDAGADALTFHPRVAPDRRSRPPKWDYIGMVKQAVSIPVFGNGNVFDQNDCNKILEASGCDGISIGRIAISKPWIFAQWTDNLVPGPDLYQSCAIKMAELLEKYFEPANAMRLFKKFAAYFTANFRFGHTFYSRLCKAKDMNEIKENICRWFEDPYEITSRPNLNLF